MNKEEEIIDFYLTPHSLNDTFKHFNTTKNVIRKILIANDIKFHSKEICNKIQSDKHKQIQKLKREIGYISSKIDVPHVSESILKYFKNIESLQRYWKEHTRREIDCFVKKTFNISYYLFRRIVLEYFKLEDRTKNESRELGKIHKENTCIQKYGTATLYQYGSKEFAELMIKKYGVDNYFKTDEMKKMTHDRCFGKRLSAECKQKISTTVKSKDCQERTKKTCLEKYGVEYTFQTENNIQKSKKTCLERYGHESYTQTSEYKNKVKQTCLEKYGVDSYSKTKEFINKLKEKFMLQYGMEHAPRKLYCVDNIYFDSFPEVALYLYAINHDETIIRCPVCFKYIYENKEHSYYPDFLYNDQLIELKGGQFLKEDGTWQAPFDHTLDDLMEAKRQCALNNNVKILYPSDYKKYLDWFKKSKYKKIDFVVK